MLLDIYGCESLTNLIGLRSFGSGNPEGSGKGMVYGLGHFVGRDRQKTRKVRRDKKPARHLKQKILEAAFLQKRWVRSFLPSLISFFLHAVLGGPSPTKSLVQLHKRNQLITLSSGKINFRFEKLPLGI